MNYLHQEQHQHQRQPPATLRRKWILSTSIFCSTPPLFLVLLSCRRSSHSVVMQVQGRLTMMESLPFTDAVAKVDHQQQQQQEDVYNTTQKRGNISKCWTCVRILGLRTVSIRLLRLLHCCYSFSWVCGLQPIILSIIPDAMYFWSSSTKSNWQKLFLVSARG